MPQTTGSRAQVMHGTAKKTSGGLTKSQLKYNKQGKIVSKKASALAKKNNRLVKAGYSTTKGVFGVSMTGGGEETTIKPCWKTCDLKKWTVVFRDTPCRDRGGETTCKKCRNDDVCKRVSRDRQYLNGKTKKTPTPTQPSNTRSTTVRNNNAGTTTPERKQTNEIPTGTHRPARAPLTGPIPQAWYYVPDNKLTSATDLLEYIKRFDTQQMDYIYAYNYAAIYKLFLSNKSTHDQKKELYNILKLPNSNTRF